MPAGHVSEARATGSLIAQIPEICAQVCALDNGHGVVDGRVGHGAVVLGGQGLQAEITIGTVGVRRIEGDQVS